MSVGKEAAVHATTFNSVLKKMVAFGVNRSLALRAHRLRPKFNLLVNESPLMVMEIVGPHLLKHSAPIKEGDLQYFIDYDYTKEYEESDTEEDRKTFENIMTIISATYKNCKAEDHDFLADLADELLISYCQYLKCLRAK